MDDKLVERPKRVQRSRARDWRMPANTVYVGRPGRWGNPFPDAASYRAWVHGEIPGPHAPPSTADIRANLAGRNLACWCCLDHECHADILLEIANPALDQATLVDHLHGAATVLHCRGYHIAAAAVSIAQTALTTEREARLRAESERDALKIKNDRWFEEFWEVENERRAVCLAVEHHSNSSTPVSYIVQQKMKELGRLTAPATDEDVERVALGICAALPGRLSEDEACERACPGCQRDARAAIEALRGKP